MTGDSFDVAIIGAGPGGSVCAALCARAGLKTVIVERQSFPRPKVCGDCLNPGAWDLLQDLGIAGQTATLPHRPLRRVVFHEPSGKKRAVPLPSDPRPEIAIRRSALDQLLLETAQKAGARLLEGQALTRVTPGWNMETPLEKCQARYLVAADGRNSSVARMLKVYPKKKSLRVAFQTHLRRPDYFGDEVHLHILADGYCGMAPVDAHTLNVCLVGTPGGIPKLKKWLTGLHPGAAAATWRTIVPLEREPIRICHPGLLFVGDAARVVEPFTGEGIYYAMQTGALAARHIVEHFDQPDLCSRTYRKEADQIYHGRLWINRLARAAVTHPALAALFIRHLPATLPLLTRRIAGSR